MLRLENKIALVTGASQGIGKCIAESFVREGATVIAIDRVVLADEYPNMHSYQVDVLDREGLKKVFDEVIQRFGKIDILVNNAGIIRDALIQKMTEEMWDLVIDVNLKGVFNLTQLVGPHMAELGEGSIINIASVVGEYGNIGQTNYSATKAGVIGMTKTWAKEFARKGANVRVNSVAPGYINTEMMKSVPEKVLDKLKASTMLGRLGEPSEIASACVFLASQESSYITGHNLSVNGGMRL